jgi:hypothetical protein
MALIECSECSRQVSDKAPACPGCGAPVSRARAVVPEVSRIQPAATPRKRSQWFWPLVAGLVALGVLMYRNVANSPSIPSPPPTPGWMLRQPQKVVSEKIGLKEGQAMMYTFTLRSESKVEVKISANPKNVDVMLMTAADLAAYKQARGKLFGGHYSYRKALSRQGILEMTEAEVLPSGEWAIVVQRPDEDALFKHDTSASVDVTVY